MGTRFGGRAKGTPNKRTQEAMKIAEAAGFCPITKQIEIHRRAIEQFEKDRSDFKFKYLEIAQSAVKDVTQYLFPKLKAIEHSGEVGGGDMVLVTRERVIEALKADPFTSEVNENGTGGALGSGSGETQPVHEDPIDAGGLLEKPDETGRG